VALTHKNANKVVGDVAILVGLVVLVVGNAVGDGVVGGVLNATVFGCYIS
jgi:hypothetical protein